jgi:transcriptional regulator with XRE-family HTH domain
MNTTLQAVPQPALTIGRRIAQARRFQGFTQEGVADSCSFSKRTLQGWERGEHDPTITGIKEIAAVTGFPVMWLIEDPSVDGGPGGDALIARYAAAA